MSLTSRRNFLRTLGVSPALWPLLSGLPSFGDAITPTQRKQRLIILFSPNGTVPSAFWPDMQGAQVQTLPGAEPNKKRDPLAADLKLPPILEPLAPFRDQTLVLKGVHDKVRGDGDNHMRGIGCLLTGVELFPGNLQGGSHTPAGWSSGRSIDQELKGFLQSRPETRTRFGSLELGVDVPDRADTWTRMVYAGPNQPIAPIDDPYQLFKRMYGGAEDRKALRSVLDGLADDFKKVESVVASEDRELLRRHAEYVRSVEKQLAADEKAAMLDHAVPEIEPGVKNKTKNLPKLTQMQMELLVSALAADFTRIATLQFTNSVGNARMRWLDIDEGHHTLSHESDDNADAQEQLIRINHWYAQQVAMLAQRLKDTPEPGGDGTLLDNTTIVWTNELGKGNNHTLDNIPWVVVGGGLGWQGGRAIDYRGVPHNRLLMSIAHAFGHRIDSFGKPDFCGAGVLPFLG